jgi:hypothetical protein
MQGCHSTSSPGPERDLEYDLRQGREKKEYLRFLTNDPLALEEFLEVTRFYADICHGGHA